LPHNLKIHQDFVNQSIKMLFFHEKKDSLNDGRKKRQIVAKALQRVSELSLQIKFSKSLNFGLRLPTKIKMTNQRKYIRFPLTLQARRLDENGDSHAFLLREIGLGGCLIDWIENSYVGERTRIELLLNNGNWFPVNVKVLYRIPEKHLGLKFIDMTLFEKEVVSKLITEAADAQNLQIENPFAKPQEFV
jgi:hypothetical protein